VALYRWAVPMVAVDRVEAEVAQPALREDIVAAHLTPPTPVPIWYRSSQLTDILQLEASVRQAKITFAGGVFHVGSIAVGCRCRSVVIGSPLRAN